MRVLLTNDDGVRHPGLWAMRDAVQSSGAELLVVAPSRDRSACGRGFSMRPLTVTPVDNVAGTDAFAVDGTPVDCVRVAYSGVKPGFVPEVVVSGLNDGANLGENIGYSGTVAGAAEGAMFGAIGIAASLQGGDGGAEPALAPAEGARIAWRAVQALCERPDCRGIVVNVNVPAGVPSGVEITSLARIALVDGLFAKSRPSGEPFRAHRDGAVFIDEAGTDAAALAGGNVTITAVRLASIQSCNDVLPDLSVTGKPQIRGGR